VDAYDQHILVMRAVEHDGMPHRRGLLVDAPQEIVRAFLLGWLLESDHAAALGIHSLDDVPAYAVLAGGIDALQDDQQGVLALGIEQFLQA
jgi:hypothetical protein